MDLQVVGEDGYSVDQVLDENALLRGRGGVPDLVNVDNGEQGRDCLEALSKLVPLCAFGFDVGLFVAQGGDLGAESSVLVRECVLADLVGVVQVEKLSFLAFQCSKRRIPVRSFLRCGALMAVEFLSDRHLELGIAAEEAEAELGCSMEAVGAATGLVAASASVLATVDGLSSFVVVHADDTPAHAALDPSTEKILSSTPAFDLAAVGRVELLLGYERLMDSGVPGAAESGHTGVHAVVGDLTDGRVAKPDFCFDGCVAESSSPEFEDALDDGCCLVGDEFAVDHVVAGGWPVQSSAFPRRLVLAHADILDQGVSVVLGKETVEADVELSSGRVEVDASLVDGVEGYAGRFELLDQGVQISGISRQPIHSPDDYVSDFPFLDERPELGHAGPVKGAA